MAMDHPLGRMADPAELLRALKALGVIDRMPADDELVEMQCEAGGEALWRYECAQHLAGALETQLLAAGGTCVDVGCEQAKMSLAGWEFYGGAGAGDDVTRIGLVQALAGRLLDLVMLLVSRPRRGEGDELLSPLVMPAIGGHERLVGATEDGRDRDQRGRSPCELVFALSSLLLLASVWSLL
jgi:hypothetical protein